MEQVHEALKNLKHRVEALEFALETILRKVPEINLSVEVPVVILERKPIYVKIPEDELHGRIILLSLEGFLDGWRTAGEVASELLRRGWAPKDFKYVRPALEHLVSLGLLERVRADRVRKSRGRRAKWLYRAVRDLKERMKMGTEPE